MQPFIPLHSHINGLIQKQLTGGERMWPCGWWSTVWRASSQGLEYNHRPHTREHTCTDTHKHTRTRKTIYILLERSQNTVSKKKTFFLYCVLIYIYVLHFANVCTFRKLLFTFHYTLCYDSKCLLFYFPLTMLFVESLPVYKIAVNNVHLWDLQFCQFHVVYD